MVSGESAAIWGCDPTPWQLTNSALQVQPHISRARAAMRATCIKVKGLQRSAREVLILASLLHYGHEWGAKIALGQTRRCLVYRKLLGVTEAAADPESVSEPSQ